MALISKSCSESYKQVQHVEEKHLDVYDTFEQVLKRVTVTPQMTLHRAVFASPACFKHALDCGLLAFGTMEHFAGLYSDLETLKAVDDADNKRVTGKKSKQDKQMHVLTLTRRLFGAAQSGSVQKLQWTFTKCKCKKLPRGTSEHAARSGSIEALQWCQANGAVYNERTSYAASQAGHAHILQFLQYEGCALHDLICDTAAEAGELSVVKWCRECGPYTPEQIAAQRPYETIKWNVGLCESAAYSGSIPTLVYLKQQGLDYNLAAHKHGIEMHAGGQLVVISLR
jgi:hypothetical protein